MAMLMRVLQKPEMPFKSNAVISCWHLKHERWPVTLEHDFLEAAPCAARRPWFQHHVWPSEGGPREYGGSAGTKAALPCTHPDLMHLVLAAHFLAVPLSTGTGFSPEKLR